jgi:hypothetical protein
MQMAMGVTPQKPTPRPRDRGGAGGSAGVHQARGLRGEQRQARGRPQRCLTQGQGETRGARETAHEPRTGQP